MGGENTNQKHDWSRGNFPTWAKMLVAVAVVLLLSLVFFRVGTIEVEGNVRYTAEQVIEASGITDGDILMAVNKTKTASRLLTKLPYLQQVILYRQMPGTIRIEVSECEAIVSAESEFAGKWMISESGKLLEELEDTAENSCPLIQGVTLSLPIAGNQAEFSGPQQGELAMTLAKALQDAELASVISEINVSDPEQVTLKYGEYLTVELGDASDSAYKLKYLKAVVGQLEEGKKGILDLSFAEGEQAVFHPLV